MAKWVTLPSQKSIALARRVTLPAEPTFCLSCKRFVTFYPGEIFAILAYSVNASPRFVRKCMRSWLTQGSSDWGGGGGLPVYPGEPFAILAYSVNALPRFVRKCMRSWLAQGSSCRRVTLQ